MSLCVLHSRAREGVDAPSVTVEVHLSGGLPALSIVGLLVGTFLLLPLVALIGRVLADLALAPVEPLIVVAVAALLFGVTVTASIIPASRAARVDPMRVLKAE